MKSILLFTLSLFYIQNFHAQSESKVIFKDNPITDFFISDQGTFYSTTKSIVQINPDDTEDVLLIFGHYLKGKFRSTAQGWTYIGWEKSEEDVVFLDAVKLLIFDGESITQYDISYVWDFEINGTIQDVVYESDEAIQILMKVSNSSYNLLTTDKEQSETVILELDVPSANEIILLSDNTKLIVGNNKLYKLDSLTTTTIKTFNENIIDINYYPKDNNILVLTRDKIYNFDETFFQNRTFGIQESEREAIPYFYR